MSTQKNITVVGAGLVGSLVSIYLAKRGYKVQIFERREDMRKAKEHCNERNWLNYLQFDHFDLSFAGIS